MAQMQRYHYLAQREQCDMCSARCVCGSALRPWPRYAQQKIHGAPKHSLSAGGSLPGSLPEQFNMYTTAPTRYLFVQDVDRKHPWPEYPRPQMQRPDWLNLNGMWQFEATGCACSTQLWP